MTSVVKRISGDYVSSLKKSVLRRAPIERASDSLVSLETNYIIEQYQKVVAEMEDRFGYLYILNIIRNNYSADLNFILAKLLENKDREVRLETISVIEELDVFKLIGDLESLFDLDTDLQSKEACLKVIAKWGPSNRELVDKWMNLDLPVHLRKYVLSIAHRNGTPKFKEQVDQEVTSFLGSVEKEENLAGIWLVGELQFSQLRNEVEDHFVMDDPKAYEVILRTAANLEDFGLFTAYINHLGYERIQDYETLNQNLAVFGSKSFDIISDMIMSIIRSKSYFKLEKCLDTLQFIPSQDSVDFLAEIRSL